MFKKLMEKVEGIESPEKEGSASPGSRRRSSMPVSGKNRPQRGGLPKANSEAVLPSISESEMLSGNVSRDDLLSAYMQRTTQLKKLENKLTSYEQSLKESQKERNKLTVVLEKQQDTAMKRMSELEETYSEGKAKMEKTIARLEKKEASLSETVEILRSDNKKLRTSLEKWETEKEEFEKKREKFYEKRENSEELNDLQMQELAKLKHMLMMREKDYEKHVQQLDQKVAELLQCQDTNQQLETSLRTTTDSLNSNIAQLEKQLQINEDQASSLVTLKGDISDLTSENKNLKGEIHSLSSELKKCGSTIASLESSFSEISEKYECLKHSSESEMNKTKVELDEKQTTIDHLKQKITLFEQRANTERLPESEQVVALIQERTSLENRLEESHLQLNNVKSTWSVKINQLEQQVSHLNKKIVEDREELVSREAKISEIELSASKTAEELKSKIQSLESELRNNSKVIENHLEEIAKLEAGAIELSTAHELEKKRLSTKHEKALEKAHKTQEDLEAKIATMSVSIEELRKQKEQISEELKKGTDEVTQSQRSLEDINKSLKQARESKESLQREKDMLNEICLENRSKLKTLEQKLISSETEISDLNEKLKTMNDTLQSKSEELLSKNQLLEDKDRQLTDYKCSVADNESASRKAEEQISILETAIKSREEELINCKTEIATLKNSQAEETEEVATLKAERNKADELLAERERLIKVQQQRLNDLKKALNKELNKKSSFARTENQRTASPKGEPEVNGHNMSSQRSSSDEAIPDVAVVATTSFDDPTLGLEQKEINIKYLKHVILTFLGGSRSEAQQLVKALAMLLSFNKDEEKFVRETLEYRGSWFGVKPATKKSSTLGKQSKR